MTFRACTVALVIAMFWTLRAWSAEENPPQPNPPQPPPGAPERPAPNIFREFPPQQRIGGQNTPGNGFTTPAEQSRKRLRDAQVELTKAQTAFNQVAGKLRAEFEKSDGLKSALAEMRTATSDLEAARKPILQALAAKTEYQAAVAQKRAAENELENLRANGGDSQSIIDAATKSMNAGSAINKMESQAMAADPKCADARKRVTEATAKLAAMRKDFEGSIKTSQEYTSAKQAVDDAQAKVKSAASEINSASARDAESDRARRQQFQRQQEQREDAARQQDPNAPRRW